MNTKLISEKALSVIDQYLNFNLGSATCPVPYYNNKKTGLRGSLRVAVGKGSPKEIFEEVRDFTTLEKIDTKNLDSISLKRILVEKNIGIDCSGLAYYVLSVESENRGKGTIDKHISFVNAHGLFSKVRAKINPEKSTDVSTLAHNKNSRIIEIKKAEPGDMITMINDQTNHILVIHQIEYQNFIPVILHYTHAMAWPTDGEYGHGVKQGIIEIIDINKPLVEQRWIEEKKTGDDNYTLSRAKKSTIEIRRLNWF